MRPGYQLKLNSYDLGVDIELADAVQRLRFEHPEVRSVVVTSAHRRRSSARARTSTCSAARPTPSR
jgi:enoyl-CoA hydratase/carnithine racemase